jgi:7-cyano-7-deazaguanine synthase
MDSCVALAQCLADGYQPAALHVNYGQRTQGRELQAFNDVCHHYSVDRRLVVDISHLAAIGGSALTDERIPVPHAAASADHIPTTYVPFRNANILTIATSWAEVLGARAIYIGAVQEDGSGYPDCREVFFRAFEAVIESGTKPGSEIKIQTPLLMLTKERIVALGKALGAPFHLTWSCYEQTELACGTCDSCRLRLKGFEGAGIMDPILYAGHR